MIERGDRLDVEWLEQVQPAGWSNPVPSGRYDLVVIGGGTAGLVSAMSAAGLGARVALIEKHRLGGDCLNVGCVPSKALLRSARAVVDARRAADFGIALPGQPTVDFSAIMRRLRAVRSGMAKHDSAERFRRAGVDVYFGSGRFTDERTVAVAGAILPFKRAVIATGTRPAVPPIPGLDEVPFLTNETLFELEQLPASLAVIGAGPIGCEMSQAFARFGTHVTLIEAAGHVLPREESDAAALVEEALRRDRIELHLGSMVSRVARDGSDVVLHIEREGQIDRVSAEAVLVSTGRRPNVTGIGLEAAGVLYDARSGVQVDERLRTHNRRIYAAGDVCSRYQFTHAADFLARTAVRNALFAGRAKASSLVVPWCTYTDPEVAHVGLDEATAEREGIGVDTFVQQLGDTDRAVIDGETEGFVKVHVKRGTDRLLGATIVARHAGELISELTLAINNGIRLRQIGNTIHPYPTQADAIRKLGDQFQRTRLSPGISALLRAWLRFMR